jgi:hypothetical protein
MAPNNRALRDFKDLARQFDEYRDKKNKEIGMLKMVHYAYRWVPVSEQLPEVHHRVITIAPIHGGPTGYHHCFNNYIMDLPAWRNAEYNWTHWTALPPYPDLIREIK